MKFKRIVATVLIFVFVFSCFIVPTNAMSIAKKKKKVKYIRVKKATYQTYKNAYNATPGLQRRINNLQTTNRAKDQQITNLKKQIADLQSKPDQSAELAQVKEELENQKSLNRWVWNNIYSLGISYKGKVWTIPNEYPAKFIIDGATYTVQFEQPPVEESEVDEE